MEEQLSIPFTNDQDNNQANNQESNQENNQVNNQENLVVQPNKFIFTKRVKILLGFYFFGIFIWGIKFLWYIFIWFITLLASSINYSYQTHINDVEGKYFRQFNIVVFPNLILSCIILCIGTYYLRFRFKIIVIINIILITGKILLFNFFYKAQKKIYYKKGDQFVPKVSFGIEAAFIILVIILVIIKVIIVR